MARSRLSVTLAAALTITTIGAGPTAAQSSHSPIANTAVPPRDVAVGDPLRPVILNALRPTIVADLGQPVMFVVQTLKVQGDWAFVVARPQQPDGREIDFRRTRYRERIENDVFGGPTLFALMQRRDQRWTVIDFAIGRTDLFYAEWPEAHGAPPVLLGLPTD